MIDTTPLAEFLPYILSYTSNAVSGRIAVEYRTRFGLSIPEWRVMAVLGDFGPLTQRQLTRMTLMDKVAVNRACKVLEDRDLAARTPNAQDGRSHLLDLTEEGVKMHDEIMPLAVAMEERIFGSFTSEEMKQFREMLERVRTGLDDLDGEEIDSRNYGIK
ncbi:DNA-binding MarR family transcriptional regulator [Altererythrobacter atlanticus]|uniref:HTH-type transcriptional repressor NicR n=1 Tax=Croceibacterium atlanticum TaxID=1267766 RepID=A0A0F7KTA2_9SPHN|nr:MarR family winged helix-turn-helix transcriptional regulator [Croceibacterium atlanticum]AKH42452.1 HTH-type transcriptional repressor NicR [Croceibacterium atlanticum]MBB5731229.1 DNA-binding MarR family transcriptional regulator [Croceibacterium atlanticum]